MPAVIALAVGLRLAVAFVEPMSVRSDAGEYWAMATNAIRGNGLVDTMGNHAYYSAGYPLLLAAVFLFTGPSFNAVLAVNLALAAASVFLVHRVARCAAGGRQAEAMPRGREVSSPPPPEQSPGPIAAAAERAGLLAALAWAVYVPGIDRANAINKENLMIPLMLGLAWIAFRWPASSRRVGLAAMAGALTGSLAIVGTTGCAVAGAPALVVLVHGAGWRQRLVSGAAFLLLAAVVVAPWLARNYLVVGAPVLNTNGGQNLYLGNNPAATGRYISTGDTPMADEWNRIKAEEGEVAAHREAARRARQYMRENPGRTLLLSLKKAALFWELPNLTSAEPEPLLKRLARYAWFVQYLALVGLALAGLRDVRRTWPLYLAIALFAAIHVPFYTMLRFRLPVMALVSCTIGVGWKLGVGRRELGESS